MEDKKKLFLQFEYNAKKAIEKSYKNENGSLEEIEKNIIKIFSPEQLFVTTSPASLKNRSATLVSVQKAPVKAVLSQ